MRRLAAVLTALILCGACAEPPQKEIDRAQGAIDAARAAGAERYAAEEFTAATSALQQAHDAVTQRDYRTALSRALTANERAQEAARQAADEKARTRAQAEVAITAAGNALQQLRTALTTAEAAKLSAQQLAPARKTAQRIDASLQEARAHVANERYPDATASVKNAIPEAGEQIRALSQLSTRSRTVRRRR
jgi:Domain of unknown function (DUF4398)